MIQTIQHGIILDKKIGDTVNEGEILAYIHTNKEETIEKAKEDILKAYEISENKPEEYKHILGII